MFLGKFSDIGCKLSAMIATDADFSRTDTSVKFHQFILQKPSDRLLYTHDTRQNIQKPTIERDFVFVWSWFEPLNSKIGTKLVVMHLSCLELRTGESHRLVKQNRERT